MRPRRVRARRLRTRPVRARRRLARLADRFGSRQSAARRAVLAVALFVIMLVPLPVLASDTPPKPPVCRGSGCRARPAPAPLWVVSLAGTWAAGMGPQTTGDGGTVPAVGQAYVAVGGGVVVLGTGLSLTAYTLAHGKELWQTTIGAPAGTAIVSVRAWQGVVTAGLLSPDGPSRTEAVINATTGTVLRRYPAAVFGGAVAASSTTTVVVGASTVTSYDNATGRVRWRREIAGGQSWQTDGQTLYVPESSGGYLSSAPVTALKVINLNTGAERVLGSPLGHPFPGTLAIAAGGAVLFESATGVTAYSSSKGNKLWAMSGSVPEGTDPDAGLVYVTSANGVLAGVDPLTGKTRDSVQGTAAAAMYLVRNGVAFGLDGGGNGMAWGYNLAKGQVTWTWPALPWPHFFSDLSGLGGSAAASGDTVAVTACPHLAATPGICADPELVAFDVSQ
jgi:outer membrane protein assembly factor BamB